MKGYFIDNAIYDIERRKRLREQELRFQERQKKFKEKQKEKML